MKLRTANAECRSANAENKTAHSSFNIRRSTSRAFTLIELILIMALIIIGVSFITPRLGGFFRSRVLNSEASQLISLIHQGQTRAVSSGVPMVLWFDSKEQKYGLEEEPGYSDKDVDAVEFVLNENLKIEIPESNPSTALAMSTAATEGPRAGLPQIRFLPDGTIAETSPQTVRIVDSDGPAISLTETRDRSQYEIAPSAK